MDGNTVLKDDIKFVPLPQGYTFESFKRYKDRLFLVLKENRTKVQQYFEIRAISDTNGGFKDFQFCPTSRKHIIKD